MRILVVRIGRAGDIIMSTPALSAIIDQYPDAEITVLTSPDGNRLLKNYHPRLKDIWIWNRSGFHNFFDRKKILKKLSTHSFDIIFCFDTGKSIISLFSNTQAKFYGHTHQDKTKHCADNYLNIVKSACGGFDKTYYAHLPLDNAAKSRVHDELISHGITDDDVIVMLHPSYSGYTTNPIKKYLKRNHRSTIHRFWPVENFGKLADMISTLKVKSNAPPKIIIDLIPEEAELGQAIIDHCNAPVELLQVKPDFERYKALINRADLLVVPNTGPMHIAAATGTKVVALFSDWDPLDCGPYMDSSLFKVIRAEDMPGSKMGLAAIPPENVLDACNQLLN